MIFEELNAVKVFRVILILIVLAVIAAVLKEYGWKWLESIDTKLREKGGRD